MATGVEELLDMLYELIEDAKSVPLSNDKCVIERDRALGLLDDLKAQFPMELSEAQKLIAARADYIASAKREAEAIKKQAEDRAEKLLDGEEVIAKARQRAGKLIQETEERCKELRRSANAYCEGALQQAEAAMGQTYEELRTARSKFRAAASAAAPAAPQRPAFDVEMEEN